ncbi:S-layer homology domain-containing protein [uncultured Oscillibacter sp.]
MVNGYGDGRLDPTGLVTRAQAVQMLKNLQKNKT